VSARFVSEQHKFGLRHAETVQTETNHDYQRRRDDFPVTFLKLGIETAASWRICTDAGKYLAYS
jgi:hypothetical protein